MEIIDPGVLFILGISVAGGVAGAWIFQRLRVPQVVGYIVIGLLIGESGFKLVDQAAATALQPFSLFALGIIGFLVGGELNADIFRKYGRQFIVILMAEGMLSFLLTGGLCGLVIYAVCGNFTAALAAGIVFGAIASATDPASTLDVLWEYRAAGVLTTAVVAIVALDDALAMTLYGLGTGVAQILTHSGDSVMLRQAGRTAIELGGAVALGAVCGFGLSHIIRVSRQKDKVLGFSIGLLLLVISASIAFRLDVILATMSIGITLVNLDPRRTRELFEVMRSFSGPVYVLFFVLVGAQLSVRAMEPWMWGLAAVYVVARSTGKWVGSWWGGRISGADPAVCRYLGMSIFAQGGVAVGLSIMASRHLGAIQVTEELALGDLIVFTVTATTLVVQLAGPWFTRRAVQSAGEVGRNITEEDVIGSLTVGAVMEPVVDPFREEALLKTAVRLFTETDALAGPVIDRSDRIQGVVTFECIKEVLSDPSSWDWLLVSDVMHPVEEVLLPETELKAALADMQLMQVEVLPVIQSRETARAVGLLDMRHARRRVRELLLQGQGGLGNV